MTHIETMMAPTAAAPLTSLTSLTGGIVRIAGAVARFIQRRRDEAALMRMDDTMLKDIGLNRGEIERAVRTGRAGKDILR